MKKLTNYISLLLTFISLNKTLDKEAKEFYGQLACLGVGVNNVLKDGQVTNKELDELTGQLADACASLVNLLEEFRIPEDEDEIEVASS